jgi:hypothetical protein
MNYYDMRNEEIVQRAVHWYNNTPHRSLVIGKVIFTPNEVEENRELEGVLIRHNIRLCEYLKQKQIREGLFDYKKGNIIMVHLDFSRTPWKFMKLRRRFNALATFKRYTHGDVECQVFLSGIAAAAAAAATQEEMKGKKEKEMEEREEKEYLETALNKPIIVPIYYTKYVCKNEAKLPEKYRNYFE